jgi:ATP-dependent Zn protease
VTDDRRRLTAIHEAGHAAMAIHVRLGTQDATIREADGVLGSVTHYPPGDWFQPDCEVTPRTRRRIEQQIMTLWAGTLAEELIGGQANPDGAGHDFDVISSLALYMCGDSEETDAYIEWLRLHSRNTLKTPFVRIAINAITDALLERETLTGKQIRSVVREAFSRGIENRRRRHPVFGA